MEKAITMKKLIQKLTTKRQNTNIQARHKKNFKNWKSLKIVPKHFRVIKSFQTNEKKSLKFSNNRDQKHETELWLKNETQTQTNETFKKLQWIRTNLKKCFLESMAL